MFSAFDPSKCTHTWSSGHTHTYTHTHTHTHLEQWTHTHTHTHTPGAVDTHTHTHTPGAVDTHTHTHTHLEQWTHTHTYTIKNHKIQPFEKIKSLCDSDSLPVVQQQTHIRPISWSKPIRDGEGRIFFRYIYLILQKYARPFVNCMGLASGHISFQLFYCCKKLLVLLLDIANLCFLPYYFNVLS